MSSKRVAIIGAGPCGLAATRYALEAGLTPAVFDARADIGGLWQADTFAWEGLHTNATRYLTSLAGHPWPEDSPLFPSKTEINRYLHSYATRFGLNKYITLNRRVAKANRVVNDDVTRWQLLFEDGGEDTFDFLKDKKEVYDLIILDPPAFAKHKDSRHQAVKGYQRLNAEAMKMIKPGGIIFTFSCSQVVDRQLFYDTIVSTGIQAGRQIKVLHHLSQPADHPVSLYHPEGEYLKGLVLYVE